MNPEWNKATPNGYISKSENLLQMAILYSKWLPILFLGIHLNSFQGLMEEILQAPEIYTHKQKNAKMDM